MAGSEAMAAVKQREVADAEKGEEATAVCLFTAPAPYLFPATVWYPREQPRASPEQHVQDSNLELF